MIGLVADLLRCAGVIHPPTRLPVITGYLGIVVRAHFALPPDWDALLLRGRHRSACYYNPHLCGTRSRFSVAHEVGHYLLHEGKGFLRDPLDVDPVEEARIEREAQDFAAELLMPTHFLLESCLHDPSFDELRDTYWVSRPAMQRRLRDLGLSAASGDSPPHRWETWEQRAVDGVYHRALDFNPTIGADPYRDYLVKRGVHGSGVDGTSLPWTGVASLVASIRP